MKISNFKGNETHGENDLVDKYNKLKDLDSQSLTAMLFEEASKQKQAGTFNYAAISSALDSMRGAISEEMYQNLKRMLKLIK